MFQSIMYSNQSTRQKSEIINVGEDMSELYEHVVREN